MTSEELVERLRRLVGQIDPCMVGGEDARLLTQAADTLQSQERRIGELLELLQTVPTSMWARLWNVSWEEADTMIRSTLTTGGGHDGQT